MKFNLRIFIPFFFIIIFSVGAIYFQSQRFSQTTIDYNAGTNENKTVLGTTNSVEKLAEDSFTISTSTLIVKGRMCFDGSGGPPVRCVVSGTVVISSKLPWKALENPPVCFDSANPPDSRYWSICPASGGPGDTIVTISTLMSGESSPNLDSSDRLNRQQQIEFYNKAIPSWLMPHLNVAVEFPYYISPTK